MILQAIAEYVKSKERIEESALLQHFRLTKEGLSPMISILLQRGKLHKSIHQRGNKLSEQIFYSYSDQLKIPMVSVL